MGAKIVFANRYFHPDLSATSQMLSDLAHRLAAAGIEVHVVCSRQLYERPDASLPARESWGDVQIHRVWTASFGRGRLWGRALDYLSFYLAAAARLLVLVRRGDVLVAKTDPPLLSVVAAMVCLVRGARLVNWLQDVFPEVATRLYAGSIPKWAAKCVQVARDWSLRRAQANIALGPRMKDYIVSRGVSTSLVRVIENWADGVALRPKAASESELRQVLGLQRQFVVAYSGNLGRAHEFDTLLDAAMRLHDDPDFVFLIIGGGARLPMLRVQVAYTGLTNFRFVPYQPRESLSDSLAAADVHLVCLLPDLEGLIVPSKFYGILAAGRPTVFVGDTDGEIARALNAGACGLSVRSGDGFALAARLRELRSDGAMAQEMAARARLLFDSRYTFDSAAAKWVGLLGELGLSGRPALQGQAIETGV